MIEEILPGVAVAVDAFEDSADTVLFPEEQAVIAKAVDKRRREFTTVRACARTALAKLGLDPVPILPGLRGAPTWPPGVVGSMSHCAGYRACALAHATDLLAIGIDAEPNATLPEGVLDAISDAGERAWITRLMAAEPSVSWDRLLFSAKESVYKAWFPLTGRWLDFKEATVTVDTRERTFAARLLVSGETAGGAQITGFTGRWLVRAGLVLTAISVPAGRTGEEHLLAR
jgi:4'-phosphopantetheinyl transferase EntD